MQHFDEADYEIDKAIADYHGAPYIAKNCQCWDGYERVPGTKPCAPGSCRKCDEGCHKKKKSSQGDKPSPHAAQAVLAALKSGNEKEAKELLKKTDCPEGCETHPEGKCNHQYMSAGRTRVRYLINGDTDNKESRRIQTSDNHPSDFLRGEEEHIKCPHCNNPDAEKHWDYHSEMEVVDCPECGQFEL